MDLTRVGGLALGALGVLVAGWACRDSQDPVKAGGGAAGTTNGGAAGTASGDAGACNTYQGVTLGGVRVCSVEECLPAANRDLFNGCRMCDGIACEPGDSCSGGGHLGGPAVSGCSCIDGTFECWITPAYDIGGTGGSGGNAGEAGAGGNGGAGALCRDDAGLSCTCADGGSGCSTESTGGAGSAGTAGSSTDAGG